MHLHAITRLVVTRDELEELGYEGPMSNREEYHLFGAGCLVLARASRRLLIPRRRAGIPDGGLWSTFGGYLQDYRYPKQAMLQHLEEQAGLSGGNPYSGGHTNGAPGMYPLMTFHDLDSRFLYYNFLVVVDREFQPRIGQDMDHAEWFEVGTIPQPADRNLQALLENPLTIQTINYRTPDNLMA